MTDTSPNAENADLEDARDPFALFASWMRAATDQEPNDPNAMALATADAAGMPDVRMVLLKGVDARGFVFYTNEDSTKGRQIAQNGRAALVVHWKSLRRQVRAKGSVEAVTEAESDAYFVSRSRNSRLGAIASLQSRPLASRQVLEDAVAKYGKLYPGDDVPRPPHWRGFRIKPISLEFWRDGAFRLHDRFVFEREDIDRPWRKTRLYP